MVKPFQISSKFQSQSPTESYQLRIFMNVKILFKMTQDDRSLKGYFRNFQNNFEVLILLSKEIKVHQKRFRP